MCDIRVGHPGVTMGQPEINSAIASTLGPWLMNERLGMSRTIELTLTGRMMPASECHAIGLIHHLVPAGEVRAKSLEIARELAAKPPIAMRLDKQFFREMTEPAFQAAIESGRRIQREAYESGEPQEWMERFLGGMWGLEKVAATILMSVSASSARPVRIGRKCAEISLKNKTVNGNALASQILAWAGGTSWWYRGSGGYS